MVGQDVALPGKPFHFQMVVVVKVDFVLEFEVLLDVVLQFLGKKIIYM
jgi:hypothetical protein